MKIFATILFLSLSLTSFAQHQHEHKSIINDPEQMQKLYESVEKTVDRYVESLKLNGGQAFKIDSTLIHDYTQMTLELEKLNQARVNSIDLFQQVQDKWNEQIYNAFRGFLDDEQWKKYLKSGAGKDKKARDKREKKRNQLK